MENVERIVASEVESPKEENIDRALTRRLRRSERD